MADVAIITYVSVFWSKNCFPFQSFSSPFHLPNMAIGHRRSLRHPHADGGEIRTLGAVFSSWLLLTLAEVNSSLWLWDICLGIAGLSCLFYAPTPMQCSLANLPATTTANFNIHSWTHRSYGFPSMPHATHGELSGSWVQYISPTSSGTFFILSYSSTSSASHSIIYSSNIY